MKILSFCKQLSRETFITLAALTLSLSTSSIAFAQEKPTISVPDFKNETNNSWWWQNGTSKQLADTLSNELTSTGKFSVVERQKLDTVISEQELAELGLVRKETAAQKGQLTGAKYIILGKVTSYEEGVATESKGGNFGLNLGIISVGNSNRKSKQEAYVAIDLRVVDSTTGEVVYARTVEGRAVDEAEGNSNNVGFLGGLINTGNDNQKTTKAPVGKALRAGLIEISNYLSCVMVDKGTCMTEYEQKEQRRRDNTLDTLQLE
jgi:curli biogenesis system outer membrane secretion channel CsgG